MILNLKSKNVRLLLWALQKVMFNSLCNIVSHTNSSRASEKFPVQNQSSLPTPIDAANIKGPKFPQEIESGLNTFGSHIFLSFLQSFTPQPCMSQNIFWQTEQHLWSSLLVHHPLRHTSLQSHTPETVRQVLKQPMVEDPRFLERLCTYVKMLDLLMLVPR